MIQCSPRESICREVSCGGKAQRPKAEHVGQNVEVAVDMQDVGAVLLSAGAADQIREADPMVAARRELMLGTFGGGHRLSVDAQVAKQRERRLLLGIVGGRGRA